MPVTRFKHWIRPTLIRFVFALVCIVALHGVFPEIDQCLLAWITTRTPKVGQWLDGLGYKGLGLTLTIVAAYVILWLVVHSIKKLAKNDLKMAADLEALHEGDTYPAGTSNLATLADKLYPEGEVPQLLGRKAQLDELAHQCELAKAQPNKLHVIAVWGEQGMGKTHLLHRFASILLENGAANLKGWRVLVLAREFDTEKLLAGIGNKPCLLLWDDISLQDDATKKRLDALKQACSARSKATVLALTSWSEPQGRTVEERGGVDKTIASTALTLVVAESIYPAASQLPYAMQGHPLMLRILSEENIKPTFIDRLSSPQEQLLKVCQFRGQRLAQRYATEHGASPALLLAVAIVSSSDALPLTPQIIEVLGLSSNDLITLRQLGLCGNHEGLALVNPIRPDLIGWAYALTLLGNESATPAQWQAWATLAWNDFFDTGRFLMFATAQKNDMHPWVNALQAPQLNNARAALNRAKAATNAVNHYGAAGNFEAMQTQLAISDAIAARFQANPEIQLVRAKAATNAVSDYGAAGKLIEASQLGEKLYAYFQQNPEMWQMPPFNQADYRDFVLQFKPN